MLYNLHMYRCLWAVGFAPEGRIEEIQPKGGEVYMNVFYLFNLILLGIMTIVNLAEFIMKLVKEKHRPHDKE